MTQPTDRNRGAYVLGGQVPGQIDLGGREADTSATVQLTAEERRDLAARLEQTSTDRAQLQEILRRQGVEAVDRIARYTAARALAGADLDQAVRDARDVGVTWEQIAAAAGITRQSAWVRWAR